MCFAVVVFPKRDIDLSGQNRGKSRLITTNAKLCTLVRRRTKYFEIRGPWGTTA
jgi:hypothetical protein